MSVKRPWVTPTLTTHSLPPWTKPTIEVRDIHETENGNPLPHPDGEESLS